MADAGVAEWIDEAAVDPQLLDETSYWATDLEMGRTSPSSRLMRANVPVPSVSLH